MATKRDYTGFCVLKVKSLFHLNQQGVWHPMSTNFDPYFHSCSVEETEFRSSALSLGLYRMLYYTKAIAGEDKVDLMQAD